MLHFLTLPQTVYDAYYSIIHRQFTFNIEYVCIKNITTIWWDGGTYIVITSELCIYLSEDHNICRYFRTKLALGVFYFSQLAAATVSSEHEEVITLRVYRVMRVLYEMPSSSKNDKIMYMKKPVRIIKNDSNIGYTSILSELKLSDVL